MREEGGTAAIVETTRLGLAMQLKMSVGVANIMAREEKITKYATNSKQLTFSSNEMINIELLKAQQYKLHPESETVRIT